MWDLRGMARKLTSGDWAGSNNSKCFCRTAKELSRQCRRNLFGNN